MGKWGFVDSTFTGIVECGHVQVSTTMGKNGIGVIAEVSTGFTNNMSGFVDSIRFLLM
jgi:hypothetical protein